MKQDRYIRFAIRMARQAPVDQIFRVGCVIVRGSVPVTCGFNNMAKTHPRAVGLYRYPSIHAELAAMIGVDDEELKGATAFVARIGRDGSVRLAKPCEGCESELRRHGVKEVWYTTNTKKIGYLDLRQ